MAGKISFRIKEAAKERGITLSGIARALGMHRSNMSAIASGARGASLKLLNRICRILNCGIDELIISESRSPVFKDRRAQLLLKELEGPNTDGTDKTWVNRIMLAHNTHYKAAKRLI